MDAIPQIPVPETVEDLDRAVAEGRWPDNDETRKFRSILESIRGVPVTEIHLNLTGGTIVLGANGEMLAKDGQPVMTAPSTSEN